MRDKHDLTSALQRGSCCNKSSCGTGEAEEWKRTGLGVVTRYNQFVTHTYFIFLFQLIRFIPKHTDGDR